MKKLSVVVETNKDGSAARLELGNAGLIGAGDTVAAAIEDLRSAMDFYMEDEGKTDKAWKGIDPQKAAFELSYNLQSFFAEYDFLSITAIAKRAGINDTLLRHYARGTKAPSAARAKEIERVIHELAADLQKVSLVA